MKNKGFTLIELITTFSLATVILVLLINVVVIIKDVYTESEIKTELTINQGDFSKIINAKITDNNLVSYIECYDSDFCYSFTFKDGEVIDLNVTVSSIKFGSYVYKLPSGTEVINPSIEELYMENTDPSLNDSILVIRIPIINKLYPTEDYGINLVYTYNSNITNL